MTGVPEVVLGICFFITWRDPDVLGAEWVKFAIELMLLEFILIHSAGFMGVAAARSEPVWRRVRGFVLLGALYSLFVLGFALSLNTWRPMITFWIITAQRLAVHLGEPKPSEETKAWFSTDLAANVLLYIGFIGLTVMAPLPRLGVTARVRDTLEITSDGVWSSEPHRAVVLAGLYYLFRGLLTAFARPRAAWPAMRKE